MKPVPTSQHITIQVLGRGASANWFTPKGTLVHQVVTINSLEQNKASATCQLLLKAADPAFIKTMLMVNNCQITELLHC